MLSSLQFAALNISKVKKRKSQKGAMLQTYFPVCQNFKEEGEEVKSKTGNDKARILDWHIIPW